MLSDLKKRLNDSSLIFRTKLYEKTPLDMSNKKVTHSSVSRTFGPQIYSQPKYSYDH